MGGVPRSRRCPAHHKDEGWINWVTGLEPPAAWVKVCRWRLGVDGHVTADGRVRFH